MLNRITTALSACQIASLALAQQQIIDQVMQEANADQPTCEQQPFCDRFRSFMDSPELTAKSDVYYAIDYKSVQVDVENNVIKAPLNLASSSDGMIAQTLDLTLTVYQNGIMRMLVEEPGVKRFRISQEDLPVVEDQLIKVDLLEHITWADDKKSFTISGLTNSEGDESWEYNVELPRFRINQVSSSGETIKTMVVNPQDTLYYESESTTSRPRMYNANEQGWDIKTLKDQIGQKYNRDVYRTIAEEDAGSQWGGVNRGIGLGFFMPSETLFGLGEREDTLVLKRTTNSTPYEMWAFDAPHEPNKMDGLYGNMPYVQGIGEQTSQAIAWINSAHSWCFLDDATYEGVNGSNINFVSETGALELFLFSSSIPTKDDSLNRNKRVTNALSTVTGFAPLPPLHTLGFHYSKYDQASAEIIMERNRNFTDYQFPVDVLVMDIQWADQYSEEAGYEYFKFNPQNFTETDLAQMNQEVEDAGRFMTTILDPHIKVTDDYFVYADGQDLEKQSTSGNVNSIFVKNQAGDADFEGDCWPGNTVWIDFLNENAQEYWAGLYDYSKFVGSTKIYHAWNDMNEPSVFSEDSKTIPTTAKHIRKNGEVVEHREFHNAYGATQQRQSYRGLIARDEGTRRPFVLTRSFFMGSQKFGGYWTGDNFTQDEEVYGSVKMIMQNGVGGNIFGGADIPGFIGSPSQEMWVRMYQAGMYYPFFRAHCDINNVDREPWIQTQRVQDVIRDAINRRYDMIHYLYTTFYAATKTGEPLVRPMWFEFPDLSEFYTTETQFMLGDSMLVAPKIDTPTDELEAQKMQEVTFTLPESAKWYNYYSKKVEQVTGQAVTRYLPDLEQAVFIKGGSVMPTLLHDDCYALTKCINDKIRLDVYIDDNNHASGSLYTDDGVSFKHVSDAAFAEVNFTYDGGFKSTRVSDASKYDFPSSQTIDQIVMYGFDDEPNAVLQNGQQVPSFIFKRGALMIAMPSSVAPDQVNIELVWN